MTNFSSEKKSKLHARAEKSLRANIVNTVKGPLLAAGAHQFRTLWVRDFCFSVPGLLAIKENDLVQRQLELILSLQNSDGLLPRGIDVVSPKARVLYGLYGEQIHSLKKFFEYETKGLRPEYQGEHGTIAFDSNLLVVLSAFALMRADKNLIFWNKNKSSILKALHFFSPFWRQDHFYQPPYSDWQDSLKRQGPQLYSHLLFLRLLGEASELGIGEEIQKSLPVKKDLLIEQIYNHFLIHEKWKTQSFESLLWLVKDPLPLFKLNKEVFVELFPLESWGTPSPRAPESEVSWTTKIIGMKRYHTGFQWSWLMAEAAICFHKTDPSLSERVLLALEQASENENEISEIYQNGHPVHLRFYKSESPFSWGAAKTLEALSCFTQNQLFQNPSDRVQF